MAGQDLRPVNWPIKCQCEAERFSVPEYSVDVGKFKGCGGFQLKSP